MSSGVQHFHINVSLRIIMGVVEFSNCSTLCSCIAVPVHLFYLFVVNNCFTVNNGKELGVFFYSFYIFSSVA